MARTTLRARGQLTIPEEIRVAAHLEEGDLLETELTPGGILLRPRKLFDTTQAWFWEPSWQAGERDADRHATARRVEHFASSDEFLDALRSAATPASRRRRNP